MGIRFSGADRMILISASVLALSACGGLPTANKIQGNTVEDVERAELPEPPANAIDLSETTPLLEFEYVIPPEAARVPVIRDLMTAQATRLKALAMKAAEDDEKSAKETGFEYRQHSDGTRWSTAADTRRLLSFQGEHFFYTGGAHPMTNNLALIFDKKEKKRIAFADLFENPESTMGAINNAYCKLLDRERLRRRGEPTSAGDLFGDCPKLSEAAILPASAVPKKIDRIRVILDAYVAGPYAEGAYVIDIPVIKELISAVKPEYRKSFIVQEL